MKFPSTSTSVSSVFSKLRILALNQTEITWAEVITFPGFVFIYIVRFLRQGKHDKHLCIIFFY